MRSIHRVLSCTCALLACALVARAQKPELVVQSGHSGWVFSIAFSPDGKLLASGGGDQTVKLWDVATGTELRELRGHTRSVAAVAFSPDGRTLASGSGDDTIKVWDVLTGKALRTLVGHGSPVACVAYSPDGRTLASGGVGLDRSIRLWDVAKGTELLRLEGVKDSVEAIAFSPDGKLLASRSGDAIQLWNAQTGAGLNTFSLGDHRGQTVGFSPDGRTLASGVFQGVQIWDVSSGQKVRKLEGSKSHVNAVAFSLDGRMVAGGGYDHTITFWDARTGRVLQTLKGHGAGVLTVAFSRDGRTLASSSEDETIKFWDVKTGAERRALSGRAAAVFDKTYSSEGRTIFCGEARDGLRLWDLARGAGLRPLRGHTGRVLDAVFSPDGRILATASDDDTVRLWDVDSATALHTLAWSAFVVGSVAFSPDGRVLAGGTDDKKIHVWDVGTGAELRSFDAHDYSINSIAYSPDGLTLASGSYKEVKLWDAQTGALRHTLKGHFNNVNSLVFSPDSRILLADNFSGLKLWNVQTGRELATVRAVAGRGELVFGRGGKTFFAAPTAQWAVKEWDLETGAELRSFEGHTYGISFIAISPDGRVLASASNDNTIRLWSLETGAPLQTITGHSGSVLSLAFSPDGKTLASGSDDRTIKLWDTQSGAELATLVSLDENDWQAVAPDGFFDGSPGGWGRVVWLFAQPAFDFRPVESFFNDFYRPGLVEEIVAGRRPNAPRDIARLDRRQPSVEISETKGRVPRGKSSASRTINLTIKVTEASADKKSARGSGAQDVRLFRNGSLVKVWRGDVLKGRRSAALPASVAVAAGENRLTAYAFNRDQIKSADAAPLVIEGTSDAGRYPTAHVLAVGVDIYANQLYNLKYAVADAREFAVEFESRQSKIGKYARIEVTRLYDREATKEKILGSLKELARKARPDDAVVVYFAGHGTARGNQFFLIPHDLGYMGPREKLSGADLKSFLAHSISDRELEEAFEKLDAGQLLMVIDACNSGQALEAEEWRRGPMNSKGLAQLAYEKGMYVLTAAQSYQAAHEAQRLGHGFLTYALIEEGLRKGAADRSPHDGEVRVREWFDYAAEAVPRMQAQKLTECRDALKDCAFGEGEENIKEIERRSIQRPRVFYRRELEARPLVISKQ